VQGKEQQRNAEENVASEASIQGKARLQEANRPIKSSAPSTIIAAQAYNTNRNSGDRMQKINDISQQRTKQNAKKCKH
jgi:hypothetical protein